MERIRYFNVETLSDLSKVKFSGDPGDTTYFTYSDTTLRQGAPDVAWHGVCTVAPVGQIYSHGKFYFPGRSGYSGTVYGVQWDTTDPSPECTRIGNLSLHATLPVQGKMVGGTMADDGTFTEFSNQGDWTGEVRDGSIGQVMVRIPTFWIKFETWGDVYKVLMSAVPVVGFTMVKEMYVSAYEASLDRTNLKLSSVVNKTAQYRGGNNQSAWDNEDTAGAGGESHRSLLGRPATAIALTDYRNYARKRGSTAWNCYFYLMHKILYWLYVVEYATLNSQKAFNSELDSNGFHQGGLGDGVSTWDWTPWGIFNDNYPFVPCGWTDEYGNATAIKNYTVYDASGTALKTFAVPRYRGVENPFGHTWKHTDGILINVTASTSDIYTTDDPNEFNSTSYDDYDFVGYEWRSSGSQYIKKLHLGGNGDITAKSGVGSSSSYYCDAHYANVDSMGLRDVMFGCDSSGKMSAGLACSRSGFAPSTTSASIGSRLTYFDAWRDVVYEEYNWLVGDGSAYIDTGIKLTAADVITTKIIATTIPSGGPTDYYIVYGNNSGTAYNTVCALFGNSLMLFRPTKTNDITFQIRYYVDTEYEIVQSNTSIDINNQQVWQGSSIFESIDWNCLIFASVNTQLHNFNGKIAYFLISDKINLVPCKLLTSIPASMDANNIARSAGECGMWDKVSNKFYGNVAQSGEFTVDGLKYYEEYKWLVAEIPPQSILMTIGVGDVFNYSRVYESIGNSSHLLTDGYNYYTSSTAMVSIGVWNGSQNIENKAVNFTNGLNVVCTQDKLTFNSVEFPKYGFPARLRWNNSANTGGADTVVKTSSITVDGSVRYVPCKLLRAIPSYMDGSGIARNAGACGMWDKVGNKFYGNVSSSGAFSVAND